MDTDRLHNLVQRTKDFALRIVRLSKSLPTSVEASVIGKQLLRCGTSVGANYRAACLSKSDKDFLNKIKICLEEADESCYWMELLIEADIIPEHKLGDLLNEAKQITSIMAAAAITTKKRINQSN